MEYNFKLPEDLIIHVMRSLDPVDILATRAVSFGLALDSLHFGEGKLTPTH